MRLRSRIYWFLGGLATLMMAAAGVSPQDARSNILAWWEIFSESAPPEWLTAPSIDLWFIIAGLGIFAVIFIHYTVLRVTLSRPKPAYFGTPMPDEWVCNWRLPNGHRKIRPFSKLVPLKEASRIVYKKTIKSKAAEIAENQQNGHAGILQYYAYALTGSGVGLDLFGKRNPDSEFEIIPQKDMGMYHFPEGVSSLSLHGKHDPVFDDLRVRRSDLRRAIREIRRWR